MTDVGVTAFKELARKVFDAADAMAPVDAADGEAIAESGFTAYVRELEEALDEIAEDETEEDALDALGKLREAVGEMAAAGAAAKDVVDVDDIAMGDLALEIEEAIDMMTTAVAAGVAYGDIREYARETIEDFTRQLMEALDEMAATDAAANDAVFCAGEVEEEDSAVDGQALLDDEAQGEMYEEAFLDELDYHEMVFATDEALDELRQEAAGCGADPPRTGFLGRYGFVPPQDLFSMEDGQELMDDEAQREMYEEAFLDELDYQEMVFAIDEASDELREEAARCSADPPRTGFLGRYGFVTPQDLFSMEDGQALMDDEAQPEMYEEAFLDELDYHEMVFAIDEASDALREEAARCSTDPPRTGFLGRYGFVTPQDLFSIK